MLSGMMRGIGARGLGGRPYLRTSAVGAAGGGRWGKASAGDVLDVGASPGVVDQLKKKALESKLAARKQPEDPNDWSWFGPRFFLLAVGGLLSAATFGYANNLAQWKDKEEEYLEIIARLQGRIHDLEGDSLGLTPTRRHAAAEVAEATVEETDKLAMEPPSQNSVMF